MTPAAARYGRERIRRGLAHFLLGKALSSVAGLATLLLLVRGLSIAEFAAYSVLQAFVEVLTALTGFGLTHCVLRYVPELYARHQNAVLRGFLGRAIGLRQLLLTLAILAACYGGSGIAEWVGLEGWVPAFRLYLLVVWVRITNHFLLQILESTLHQARSQSAFLLNNLLRLGSVIWLVWSAQMSLPNVIWAELAAESVCLVLLAVGVAAVMLEQSADRDPVRFSEWWRANRRRVLRYGAAGYSQHLAILPYGSSPSRLVAGRFLSVATVADFGFARSLADTVGRYLPATLFSGLVRPVLVARFSSHGDFGEARQVAGMLFRLDSALLGWGPAALVAVGDPAMRFVSKGRYGAESALLLVALAGVAILESRRGLLEMAVQIAERYDLLIGANLLLAASLPLSILFIPDLGAMALPLAAALCLVASNAWIGRGLDRARFRLPFGWPYFTRLGFSVGAAAALGYQAAAVDWRLGLAAACAAYPLLLWATRAVDPGDWALLGRLRRPQSSPTQTLASDHA